MLLNKIMILYKKVQVLRDSYQSMQWHECLRLALKHFRRKGGGIHEYDKILLIAEYDWLVYGSPLNYSMTT